MFNTIATNLVSGAFCVWEQSVNTDNSKNASLLSLYMPEIYKDDRDSYLKHGTLYIYFFLTTLVSAIIMYFITIYSFGESMLSNGQPLNDLFSIS